MIRETKDEISYLESIQTSLDIAMTEDDLAAIKEELSETGYVRRKTVRKKIKLKNEPLHYISSDGFHMYVGKIIFKTTPLHLILPPDATGGFMQNKLPDHM